MKVIDAIDMLKKSYDPNAEILIAWWQHEDFEDVIPYDAWEATCDRCEYKLDWSSTWEQIEYVYDEYVKEA